MICNCSLAGTATCKSCPSHRLEEEGRFPSKVFFSYGVDAVEVVRCKDCMYYEIVQLKKDGSDDRRYKPSYCMIHSEYPKPDYYCADGERREVTE